MAGHGRRWVALAIFGCFEQFSVVSDSVDWPWPAIAGHCRPWAVMASHCRPWPAGLLRLPDVFDRFECPSEDFRNRSAGHSSKTEFATTHFEDTTQSRQHTAAVLFRRGILQCGSEGWPWLTVAGPLGQNSGSEAPELAKSGQKVARSCVISW